MDVLWNHYYFHSNDAESIDTQKNEKKKKKHLLADFLH